MTGKADTVQAGTPAWLNALLAIGGLGTLISGLGVWWKNLRDSKLAEKKDGRDASLDHVELISRAWDEYDKLIDRLSKAEERVTNAEHRAEGAEDRANQADEASRKTRSELRDITERVRHLETDTSHIVGFLVIVKQGIRDGTIPPWPEETPVVRSYMSRITITQQE